MQPCSSELASVHDEAEEVVEHLGLPPQKGHVRISSWSNPLSQEQSKYAAANAYAGYMLYHDMDATRVSL
ncbi:hypothetical protein VPNG_05266 [Cytospora leucostoma]|uniref:3'-5' exonuclease domain-containing protein n=1 Tax=Cytospora leucostoma TaxID=1230097 RepID=A0A423X874_9PEZI|nr:hypothetical protein VPNG_05266 [Cytospora leucostoma]